ncbi:hypothetical protein Sjap_001489 [Stephania japonica]|uniref:Protein kinase domain-containing protein n=1 Tax=Stephania japonica TaxID=461633 RepID=A0AAP0KLS9_9MAGN
MRKKIGRVRGSEWSARKGKSNLKDLRLKGTLGPELGNLIHVKSIVLRNNSFSGLIPNEIKGLKSLEVFDIRCNNFSGPLPLNFGSNPSLSTLLLDHNNFFDNLSPELHGFSMLSKLQVDDKQLSTGVLGPSHDGDSITWKIAEADRATYRRMLQERDASSSTKLIPQRNRFKLEPVLLPLPAPAPAPSPSSLSSLFSPSPLPSAQSVGHAPSSVPAPSYTSASTDQPNVSSPSPSTSLSRSGLSSRSKHSAKWIILIGGLSASAVILISIGIFFCRSSKAVIVKPWATGLSGQLQKAFVTGVPKLKRSELEAACEDFSNIIGSLLEGMVYKGTLSSGVEIAVISSTVKSSKSWSKRSEGQFRKKVDVLSKVNHKNFVNLLGFCEEENPFTRIMVFEYAPNGTLFEHLHVKEAEHLDWGTRLRIAMGMAYCLDHMHQLTPPIFHKNLCSTSVYLTEDYAAKISDFGFWNDVATTKTGTSSREPASSPESVVYDFGVVLLEILTGRLPYSENYGFLIDWASDYLRRRKSVRDMVDPTLKSFQEEQLRRLCEVVSWCINPDPKQRPSMREVTACLREITAVTPDGATPKLSPLWWAELEILSADAS